MPNSTARSSSAAVYASTGDHYLAEGSLDATKLRVGQRRRPPLARIEPVLHGSRYGNRQAEVDSLRERFVAWANRRSDVHAVAVVGSWARGHARSDSDVDFVVLTSDVARYIADEGALADVVAGAVVATVERGVLTERRLRTSSGLEVDVGFAPPSWAQVPVDPGTARVVLDGLVIVFDPEDLLARLREAVSGSSSEPA